MERQRRNDERRHIPNAVELDGNEGWINETSSAPVPGFTALLKHFGYDPDEYEIVEPIQVRTWDAAVGDGKVEQMWYRRARIKRRTSALSFPQLRAEIAKLRPRSVKVVPKSSEYNSYVVVVSDPQIGKGAGGGTPATVERAMRALQMSLDRLRALRKAGRRIDRVVIMDGGDLIENVQGHYPAQAFTTDLNRRQQIDTAAELMHEYIDAFAAKVERVDAVFIPSNHGENRSDGKILTTPGDNADLEIADGLKRAYSLNSGRFGHVHIWAPKDDIAVTFTASGTTIGLTHGHVARGSGTAEKKQMDWWKGQALGDQHVSGARILVTGHYHHFRQAVFYGRTWIQCPALDGGSPGFTDATGDHSPPGVVTFVAGTHSALGWSDLEVQWV